MGADLKWVGRGDGFFNVGVCQFVSLDSMVLLSFIISRAWYIARALVIKIELEYRILSIFLFRCTYTTAAPNFSIHFGFIGEKLSTLFSCLNTDERKPFIFTWKVLYDRKCFIKLSMLPLQSILVLYNFTQFVIYRHNIKLFLHHCYRPVRE